MRCISTYIKKTHISLIHELTPFVRLMPTSAEEGVAKNLKETRCLRKIITTQFMAMAVISLAKTTAIVTGVIPAFGINSLLNWRVSNIKSISSTISASK